MGRIVQSTLIVLAVALAAGARAAAPSGDAVEFFERNVRPILAEQCYSCHSTESGKSKGNLLLDSQPAMLKGGDNGPALVAGDPEKSRLIEAVRWNNPDLQMPPKRKLTDQQIARLEQWVKIGAPDPRTSAAASKTPAKVAKTTDLAAGRAWWAFQPVKPVSPPTSADAKWEKTKIDGFISAKLSEQHLAPSPEADRRTLIERAYLDLTGLRPTYDEVEAFANDESPDAYATLIDHLLASPHYGERWGRYWLDVARYGEDNPTSEATNPPYRYAWRYRDWVIGAMNRDVPYDRFVKLQLAADLLPDTPRSEMPALGFLGAAPVYHKDGRLSRDVIETLYTDDWDERVDTVTRGVLGLTVACARCHDHKFDPISTKDYYSLAGVFASTVAAPRPLGEIDKATETRFMAASQRIFYLSYVANLLRGEPGSKPAEARQRVERCLAEMERTKAEMAFLKPQHPELYAYIEQLAQRSKPYPDEKPPAPPTNDPAAVAVADDAGGGGGGGNNTVANNTAGNDKGKGNGNDRRRRFRQFSSNEPLFQGVFDAGLFVNGSDPDFTMIDVKPGEPHDMHVLPGGNVTKPGAVAPRGFITVLAKGTDTAFHQGSGRRELAERMFTDAAPLAARVIVNRAWAWHFGKPLVATQSDFGAQGDKPTHPELLDDLSARFIQNGWSLKWLHREIMLSATYRQASHPRADAARADPSNNLLWRMNPRRLDIEAYRDCLLEACGTLDTTAGGPSNDLDQPGNTRRTVYARVSRGRLNSLFQLYDFPLATMHSPNRETTTTPLQQLFVMNSTFIEDQAATLAKSVEKEPDVNAKVRAIYRKVMVRDPSDLELKLAGDYLKTATLPEYCQAVLSTNEVIFWP